MRYIAFLLIILSLATSCTESNVSTNNQPPSCNLSDLSIFPHSNDAGVTLAVLVMDKSSKKYRIIGIGGAVCEGYKLYRIMPNGIELKNNDGQIKQIAYAGSSIISEPVIKLEQVNRQAIKKAEQLQKYGIPQMMDRNQSIGNKKNVVGNSIINNKLTGK